jgi:hypothetical protein
MLFKSMYMHMYELVGPTTVAFASCRRSPMAAMPKSCQSSGILDVSMERFRRDVRFSHNKNDDRAY